MIKDGIGGGNTITGFIYEAKVDFIAKEEMNDYCVLWL